MLYTRKSAAWRLADFGLTCEGKDTNGHTTRNGRGTPSYRAPELLQEDKAVFNNKVDIWSLGCILYELAAGKKAFSSDLAVCHHAISKQPLTVAFDIFDQETKASLTDQLRRMLEIEPASRPSAASLFEEFSRCLLHKIPSDSYVRIHQDFTRMRLNDSSGQESLDLPPKGIKFCDLSSDLGPNPDPISDADRTDIISSSIMIPLSAVSSSEENDRSKAAISSVAIPQAADIGNYQELRSFRLIRIQSADPAMSEDSEWTTFYVVVNKSNTRFVTCSSDDDNNWVRTSLWDTASGTVLWRKQELSNVSSTQVFPAFCEDGTYLVLYSGKSIVLLEVESATVVKSCRPFVDVVVEAVAVSRNGRRIAISTEASAEEAVTPGANLTSKIFPFDGTSGGDSCVDIITTTLISDPKLAYVARGRRLMMIGKTKSGATGSSSQIGLCWDTQSMTMLKRLPLTSGNVFQNSPLYATRIGLSYGFQNEYSNIQLLNNDGLFLSHYSTLSYMLLGISSDGLMIVKNKEGFRKWDIVNQKWLLLPAYEIKEPADNNGNPYLWKLNSITREPECVGRIPWDNRLSPYEVKGIAVRKEGLTFITENEGFIFIKRD